ncbi:MAG: hypothetical protein ACKVQC_10505 [Elusimicrobiota bacterium]
MIKETLVKTQGTAANASEFVSKIQTAMRKSDSTNKGFFVILLQLQNIDQFKKKRPSHVLNSLYRELFYSIRQAVHPSQFVGIFENGLGLVFDNIDVGQVDTIARRLVVLTQQVIRNGKYNDLASRWTDIVYDFLFPNKPMLLMPKVGWSIYPRDGATPLELISRAYHHSTELSK